MESADTQQFPCIPSSLEVAWAKPVSIFSAFPQKNPRWTGENWKGEPLQWVPARRGLFRKEEVSEEQARHKVCATTNQQAKNTSKSNEA